MALGLGAEVTVIDRNLHRLRHLDSIFHNQITTRASNVESITECITGADLVIGAVLIPGKKAPIVMTRAMLSKMPHGSVIVDISIDQGGCFETRVLHS